MRPVISNSRQQHTVFSVVRDGVCEVGNRLLSAAHIAGDAKTILLQPFSLFFTGLDSMTNVRQDVRTVLGGDGHEVHSFPSGTHQMVHDQCTSLRDTTAGLVGHAVQVINPRILVDSEVLSNAKQQQDAAAISNCGRVCSLRARFKFAEKEAAAIDCWANWRNQDGRTKFEWDVVDAIAVLGAEQIVARVCVVAFKIVSCGLSVASVVVGVVALPFALVGALFSNGMHFSDYVDHQSLQTIPGHRAYRRENHRLCELSRRASLFAADNIAEVWVFVEEVHNLVLGFLRPVLLVPGSVTVDPIPGEDLSLASKVINVVLDIVGNLFGRVSAVGEMFLDGKTLFLQPFAMFFTVMDSLTTVRRGLLQRGNMMIPIASGSHIVAKRGFELLRDAFAALLGHAVRVVNPNAYVDSRLIVREESANISPMSVSGRVLSIRERLFSVLRPGQRKTFADWQDRQIHYFSYWGSFRENRTTCLLGKALMEHVIARVVVVGVRLLGIGISAGSVVAGAIVLPFALVGVLLKNASDLLIYHRNGWGERNATYVPTVPGDRCYDVFTRVDEDGFSDDNSLFSEEHLTHRMFEQNVAQLTLFAIDNLSEVFTIALEVHHLVLAFLRPVLLVPATNRVVEGAIRAAAETEANDQLFDDEEG